LNVTPLNVLDTKIFITKNRGVHKKMNSSGDAEDVAYAQFVANDKKGYIVLDTDENGNTIVRYEPPLLYMNQRTHDYYADQKKNRKHKKRGPWVDK
jgi:superoxide dismutase